MDLKSKPKLSIEKQVNEFLVTKGVKFNLNHRIRKNEIYYKNNTLLKNSYLFMVKFFDIYI